MSKNTIIIIDDEPSIRQNLKHQLKLIQPNVQIVAEANNVEESLAILQEYEAEIVFLDIEMPDGTGFDLLKKCQNFKSKLIFITAHNDYAVQAFKVCALDYLLKPIDLEELEIALEKANDQLHKENTQFKINTFLDNIADTNLKQKKIVLKTSESIEVVTISDIVRLESSNNYTSFYLKNGHNILISKTLKDYEDILEGYGFFRIHQSHLVNMIFFQKYEKKDGGLVVLKDGTMLPLSSRKKDAFLKVLESL